MKYLWSFPPTQKKNRRKKFPFPKRTLNYIEKLCFLFHKENDPSFLIAYVAYVLH